MINLSGIASKAKSLVSSIQSGGSGLMGKVSNIDPSNFNLDTIQNAVSSNINKSLSGLDLSSSMPDFKSEMSSMLNNSGTEVPPELQSQLNSALGDFEMPSMTFEIPSI